MNKRIHRFWLAAAMLAAWLSGGTAAWADGGLMSELRDKAMHDRSHGSDRRYEQRDRDRRGDYRGHERRGDDHYGQHTRDRHWDDRGRGHDRHERRDGHKERYVTRYRDRYVTHHRYYDHDDDGQDLLIGLLLGGLFGYAVGNAEPAYGYDYGR